MAESPQVMIEHYMRKIEKLTEGQMDQNKMDQINRLTKKVIDLLPQAFAGRIITREDEGIQD